MGIARIARADSPALQKRKPDYDSLNKLARVRSNLYGAGFRPRLHLPVTYYTLGRLKDREASSALRNLEYRAAEIDALDKLVPETQKVVKMLKSPKTNAPRDAYYYLASVPPEMLAFIEVEMPNSTVLSKIRNYLQKWRPLRMASPARELEALGVERGPKFDKVMDQFFEMQLRGKGKTPEDRVKILKNLAGIKDEPKKPEKVKKEKKGDKEAAATTDAKGKAKAQPVAPGKPATGKSPARKNPCNPLPRPSGRALRPNTIRPNTTAIRPKRKLPGRSLRKNPRSNRARSH